MSERQEYSIFATLPANRFHSCILTTFSFDFNYFNHDALSALSRAGVINTCILVDDSMLQQYLGTITGYPAKAARRYSISGIVRNGAFHPKLYLFFGREGQGFLIVGSGNLTASGHGSNQELWGAFHINGLLDPKASIFKNAWKYVHSLSTETYGIARRKVEWVKQHTPWLDEIPDTPVGDGVSLTGDIQCFLLSNANGNMLMSIQTHISSETVREITLISPFFDSEAFILRELADSYPDANIHAIVQPDSCSASFKDILFRNIKFYNWNTIPGVRNNRYLHAKLLHIRTESNEYCMFGSANMTAPALGTRKIPTTNEEVCLLLRREKGNWIDDLGLQDKGKIILASDIPVNIRDTTNDALPEKKQFNRLKAIDRLGVLFQVYINGPIDAKDLIMRLFDGWGNVSGEITFKEAEYQKESGHYRLKAAEISEDILYGQLFNSTGLAVSNKQIIHDVAALSRTNPDPATQKMEDVLDQIEFGDADLLDILSYLHPDDLARKDDDGSGSRRILDDEGRPKDDGTGEVLEYDEFTKISPELIVKGGFSHLYGTHRIERVLETLRAIFEKLKIRDVDISAENEEADRDAVESSEGRFDYEERTAKHVHRKTPSGFADLQKTVFHFFDQYIKILEKQRTLKHKPNILDISMFTIALHLLLDFRDKEILVKKRGDAEEKYTAILLSTKGDYFEKTDYCRIVVEIIGKFTLLLINGIDNSNDEYVQKRIEKCKRMAYWHGVCCIARLIPNPRENEGFEDLSSIWKWELGINLQHYFTYSEGWDETAAAQEIEYRTRIMTNAGGAQLKANILAFWSELVQQYRELDFSDVSTHIKYDKLSRIFCKLCGFGHIHEVVALGSDYKVTLARPGYPPNHKVWDFEGGQKVMATMAKIKYYGKGSPPLSSTLFPYF
ncbi:MAG: hypothetical protein HZB30_10690 [Nitrospirae bacterium]|nr:hypothetical protein [Nitrospirota bacterium]